MNDFNDDDFDNFDEGFDEFKENKSIKDVWNENPLIKIFTIIAGIILLITAIVIFTSGSPEEDSTIRGGVDQRETLGGEISQSYADVLEEVNDQRLEQAVQTGGSTIPMLINPEDQELLTASEELPPANNFDPLANFRAAIAPEEPEAVEDDSPVLVPADQVFTPDAIQQPVPAPSPEAIQALATAMATNVSDILANHNPTMPQLRQVTPEDFLEVSQGLDDGNGGQMIDTDGDGFVDTPLGNFSNTDFTLPDQDEVIIETVLLPAGTINYGQVLIEANSDIPGPVLVQLVSGPLAGARLIGDFTVANDMALVLSFNSIVINGLNQPVSAIAIDPGTTLPGVATEVNNRYFQRVLLPAAARFLEGIGSAIAEDSQTTVTVSGDTVIQEQSALDFEQELGRGAEEGLGEIADFMEDEADDIQPLVRVARGTPVGVFFVEPVLEVDNNVQ